MLRATASPERRRMDRARSVDSPDARRQTSAMDRKAHAGPRRTMAERVRAVGRPWPRPPGRVSAAIIAVAVVAAVSVAGGTALLGAPPTPGPGTAASPAASVVEKIAAPLVAGHEV